MVKYRTHPGVAGALNNHQIPVSGHPPEGISDLFINASFVRPGDILFGKSFFYGYGAHILDSAIHPADILNQHRVLIHLLSVFFQIALADGLDKTDILKALLKVKNKPHSHGGLAVILHGGGNKDFLSHPKPISVYSSARILTTLPHSGKQPC